MRYITYLKERIYQILILLLVVASVETLLLTVEGSGLIGLYVFIVSFLTYFIGTLIEFRKKKAYFMHLFQFLDALDKKYLLPEMMPTGRNKEEKLFREVLMQTGKSMSEHVNEFKLLDKEYKDYIEMWIHEVKVPIATGKLIAENYKSDVTDSIEEELNKIESFTEQALYYARSNYVEKDYLIKKTNLTDVIHEVLVRNKKLLIANKCSVDMHDLGEEVLSDSKWLSFILNQIVSNSIKYAEELPMLLEIYAVRQPEKVQLFIKDNGVGIKKDEIARVFEKGFTGTNGRNRESRSTGIGLYLCKKLCEKLKHSIEIISKEENGCTVIITFPDGSFTNIV